MRAVVAGLAALLLLACAEPPETADTQPPAPDLSEMEPRVRDLLQETRQAVLDDPSRAETWGKLGGAFDTHGLYDEAQLCYRRAVELDRTDFRWAYLLAVVRDVNGAEAPELVQLFGAAIELDPEYAPAQFRLGHALSLRGSFGEAEAAFRRAIELDPQLAVAHRELGQVLLTQGNADGAVGSLLEAARLAPHDGSVLSTLASAYTQLDRHEEARASAERARRLEPVNEVRDPVMARNVTALGTSARHWVNRSQARLARGDFEGAIGDLVILEEIRPEDPDVHYLLGLAHGEQGRSDEALRRLNHALVLKPDHVRARVELARRLEALGRADEALTHYRRSHELSPRDPAVLAALAQALARRGDMEGLVGAYRKMAQLVPRDPRLQLNLGTALARTGDFSGAARAFGEALAIDPDYADAHYRLGVALERLGQPAQAREHYVAAVRIDPKHVARRRLDALNR